MGDLPGLFPCYLWSSAALAPGVEAQPESYIGDRCCLNNCSTGRDLGTLQGIDRDFIPGKLPKPVWRNFLSLKQTHSRGKALISELS